MPNQSFNYMNVGGLMPVDDMEIVEELGLDPKVAYSPAINSAALAATQNRLRDELTAAGETESGIERYVAVAKSDVMDQIKAAEQKSGIKLI